MPKLKTQAITEADLADYLAGYSDFSFELKTLKRLRSAGLQCEHRGLYEDPVTKKSREFDIRARARHGNRCVYLAIECKNVRESFPLLISCVPRHPDESFHEVAIAADFASDLSMPYVPKALQARAKIVRIEGNESVYKPGEPVGKSMAQVGRVDDKDAAIHASDSEMYDKWAQCLASAHELVSRAYAETDDEEGFVLAWVLPVVVVPDGRLWIAHYDANGTLVKAPAQTSRCSVFVDKFYDSGDMASPALRASHMDIMTLSGLMDLVSDTLKSYESMATIFPDDPIRAGIG
jgi:hypothetical protein